MPAITTYLINSFYGFLRIPETRTDNRRLIFCINSGRAGSNYLAALLNTAEEVSAFHEPRPAMNGKYLQMVNRYDYKMTYNLRKIKCKAIYKILKNMSQNEIYCETNHMFIKTFFDVVSDTFKNIEVIILHRSLAHVLKSFIELNYFTNLNKAWPKWMSSPNARTKAIACIDSDSNLDQYDLSIAYLIDIESRALRFQKEYPEVRVHQVRLESLNDYSNVESLFQDLRITITGNTKNLFGEKINTRENVKDVYNNQVDLGYCRKRLELYMEKAIAQGIAIPNTLALEEYKIS